VSDFLFV